MFRSLLTTIFVVAGFAALAAPARAQAPNFVNSGNCFPQINTSLYPSPKPDVPREVGWTVITTPALSPHEMLYAHQYRAMYPPYFYKNTCRLACLPFFPKPALKGTVVTVKYRTCWGLHGACPPACATKKCFSHTQFK